MHNPSVMSSVATRPERIDALRLDPFTVSVDALRQRPLQMLDGLLRLCKCP
jgi:hypothetical protein